MASIDRARPEDLPIRFGRMELVALLGEGGMGRVFEAVLLGEAGFRKRLALKVIRADVSERVQGLAQDLVNEARTGGLLHHPGVVDVYDFGITDGQPWIAMELVRGCSLADLLAVAGQLPARLVLQLGASIAAALDHAHGLREGDLSAGLVHRDLKPSNVLLGRDGDDSPRVLAWLALLGYRLTDGSPASLEQIRRLADAALERGVDRSPAMLQVRYLAAWLLTALPPAFAAPERGRVHLEAQLEELSEGESEGASEEASERSALPDRLPGLRQRHRLNTAWLLLESLQRLPEPSPDVERLRGLVCRLDPACALAELAFLSGSSASNDRKPAIQGL